jgi:hypothetical protein
MRIFGNVGIDNTLNITDYIVAWNNVEFQTNADVIQAELTNKNMIIKETGNYLISARYSSYDLTNQTDSMRIRVRGQFNVPITSTGGGVLIETLQESFIGLDSTIYATDINGRATAHGTIVLRITQVPYYLAITMLHRGGAAIGGTAGYPVFENSLGSLPYFFVQRLTY